MNKKEFPERIIGNFKIIMYSAGADPGGGGGGALGAEVPPFIFRLYLINMLSIIMKFCLIKKNKNKKKYYNEILS